MENSTEKSESQAAGQTTFDPMQAGLLVYSLCATASNAADKGRKTRGTASAAFLPLVQATLDHLKVADGAASPSSISQSRTLIEKAIIQGRDTLDRNKRPVRVKVSDKHPLGFRFDRGWHTYWSGIRTASNVLDPRDESVSTLHGSADKGGYMALAKTIAEKAQADSIRADGGRAALLLELSEQTAEMLDKDAAHVKGEGALKAAVSEVKAIRVRLQKASAEERKADEERQPQKAEAERVAKAEGLTASKAA